MPDTPLAAADLTSLFQGASQDRIALLKEALDAAFAPLADLTKELTTLRDVRWEVTGPTYEATVRGQRCITAYVTGPDIEVGLELRPDNFYNRDQPIRGWVAEASIYLDADEPGDSNLIAWRSNVSEAMPERAISGIPTLLEAIHRLMQQRGVNRDAWRADVR